jgi:hypothetical protein
MAEKESPRRTGKCNATKTGLPRRWCAAAIASLVIVVLLAGAEQQYSTPPKTTAPSNGSPLEGPLQLIAEAAQSYQGIRDYTCLFVKREQIQGQLQPDNLIEMRARTQPFSIYMRWLGPQTVAGQEACYVAGRNNGMMRVHSTGLAGAIGFTSLDVRDPRVMQNNRHTITEAGIGVLIDRLNRRWQMEKQLNRTQVSIADYSYNQRPCTRVETVHPDNAGGQFYAYRSVVYFDKENHLPIRAEHYDWPRQRAPNGDLIECYSFANLRLNIGLTDRAFAY